jgi:undecaprenyl-diphosphatase
MFISWSYRRLIRVPKIGPALARGRSLAPSGYLALHLALGLIVTASIVAFLAIAGEVSSGREIAAFDEAFGDALLERTTPRWRRFFVTITWFGAGLPIAAASLVVALVLAARRLFTPMIWWIIAQVGAGVLIVVLKAAFARSRPEIAYETNLASGWSFPSGHALGTFVFCALGAYLVFRLSRSLALSTAVAGLAAAVGLVMSFSRVYLGAHFLSDVVAGMIVATAWVAVCISGNEIAQRRWQQR